MVTKETHDKVVTEMQGTIDTMKDSIKELKEAACEERVVEVIIRKRGSKTINMKDTFHKEFQRVLQLAQARRRAMLARIR